MNVTNQSAGLVAFAGFALAAPLAAWLAWPPPPEPEPPPAVCERADELGARLIAGRAVLAQEIARLERVRAEDLRMTGEPPERPADLPPELSGQVALQAVSRALAPSGARVVDVLCDEYPCLALVVWTGPAAQPAPDPGRILAEAGLGSPGQTGSARIGDGLRRSAWVLALLPDPPGITPGQDLRLQRRSAAALGIAEASRDAE